MILDTLEEQSQKLDPKFQCKRSLSQDNSVFNFGNDQRVSNILFKVAPALLITSVLMFVIALGLGKSEDKIEKANVQFKRSHENLNKMVENMSKAITVIQKFEEKNETIEKLYNKIQEDEMKTKERELLAEKAFEDDPSQDVLDLDGQKENSKTNTETKTTGQSPTVE